MNALKVVSMRLRGTTTKELEAAGEDTDGLVENTSKLYSKIKALTAVNGKEGISILGDDGQYKSTYEILTAIAERWEEITAAGNDSAILELMAGKTRGSVVAALLQQPEVLKEAYNDAMNASGSATKELEKHLDSIQGRIDLFNNAVQTMWSNAINDDAIKGFVNFGTTLINIVDKLGLVKSSLAGVAAGLSLIKKQGFFKVTENKNRISFMGLDLGKISFKELKDQINAYNNSLTKSQDEQDGFLKTLSDSNPNLSQYVSGLKGAKATTNGYITSLIGAKLSTIGLTVATSLLNAALTMGLSFILQGIITLLQKLWGWIKSLVPSTEDLTNKLNDLKSELSDIQQEIDSLNSELETTQDRMAELLAMDHLSFTEQEELSQLKKENDELERKLHIQQELEKTKQNDLANSFVDLMNTDLASEEYGERWFFELYDIWGNKSDKEYSNKKYYGSTQSEKDYIDYLLDTANTKFDNFDYTKFPEITKYLDDKIKEMEDAAEGIQYGLNDETDRWLDFVYNARDKWSILKGENTYAKSDAITRIFNKDEFDSAKKEIDSLVAQLEQDPNNQTILDKIREKCKVAEADLIAVGLSAEDAYDYFTTPGDNGGTIVDDSSITDTLSSIKLLEEAYNNLGDAIKEFKEDGTVAAGTLESLKETFGDTDGFEELYKVLATGEGDVETAIANVANAYIAQKESLTDISEEEQSIMIARLKALGVVNAEEVFQVKQVAQEKLNALGEQYSIDLSNYATAEAAKLAIAQQINSDVASMSDEEVENKLKGYGEELSDYASVAEAKIAIARRVAKETAEINRQNALNELNSAYVGFERYRQSYKNEKQAIEDEYNAAIAAIPSDDITSNLQSIVDSAYSKLNFDFSSDKIGTGRDFADTLTDKATKDAEDAFQKEMDYWENQISAKQAQYDQVQNEMDRLEKQGKRVGKEYYQQQIKIEGQRLGLLKQQKAAAEEYMNQQDEATDAWWEAAKQVNDLEGEIDDVTLSIWDLNNAIANIKWDNFEEITNRISDLSTQLSNVRDLLSSKDMFDEDGNFTDAGIATLATYVQELEIAKNALNDVNSEIDDFVANRDDYISSYSEQKYYDDLKKLTDEQSNYLKIINDSEQSVKDMYENQIDAIEEFSQKAVDAYNDYIDVVKEALDAERDLHDFKKNINKQTKDIGALERRIAALSGSTAAADVAERRKLEAQLLDAKEELNETYYDHATEQQSKALDDESKAFEEATEKYIEGLRDSLKEATQNMTEFIGAVSYAVATNAETVQSQYESTRLVLDSALTTPWVNATNEMKKFGGQADIDLNSWVNGGFISSYSATATTLLKAPWSAAQSAMSTAMQAIKTSVESNVATTIDELKKVQDEINKINSTTVKPSVNNTSGSGNTGGNNGGNGGATASSEEVKTLQKYLNEYWNTHIYNATGSSQLTVDGIAGSKTKATISSIQAKVGANQTGNYDQQTYEKIQAYYNSMITKMKGLKSSQEYYRNLKAITPAAMYAKGALATKKDQWAITDEPQYGDELVIVPNKGVVSYMRKGTSVIPADLTENLMEWGQMNPNMMNMGSNIIQPVIANTSNNTNAIQISFDSLVKTDYISKDILPEVEDMVSKQLDKLVKQMNYSIKKFK